MSISQNLQFELKNLIRTYKILKYKRFDNYFYAQYETLKKECSIGEFAWNWCIQPKYAKQLISLLDQQIPNLKHIATHVAKSNAKLLKKKVKIGNDWDYAFEKVVNNSDKNKAKSMYCTDFLYHPSNKKKLFLDDADGELWHGVLINKDCLPNIECFNFEFNFYESPNEKSALHIYEYTSADIKEFLSKHTYFDDQYVLFVPFRKPVPLLNFKGTISISFNMKDSNGNVFKNGNTVRPVYSVCNQAVHDWIAETPIKVHFQDDDKYLFYKGYVTEL